MNPHRFGNPKSYDALSLGWKAREKTGRISNLFIDKRIENWTL
jgi:hypothetical protein